MASSPRGDTTESTYIDLGATTPEAHAISRTSREYARRTIGDATLEDRVRQRCAIAVGDLGMADLIRFRLDPIGAGLEALRAGVPIVADIRMVQTGLQKRGHASPVLCALDHGSDIAVARGITRTSAGLLALQDQLDGAIVVIGNAPSVLLALVDIVHCGSKPALVIGTPVGFVNAAESKALLRELEIPSISNVGTRGGTPVAVAAMNEIVTIFAERQV